MSNVYGVAHFAKQNAVPQVEWKNIDIIGQYIDNLNKQKQLEMMDKSYELAKDQAAFAREKFGYDQERDKVKDVQWDKQFEYNKFNDAENRKANFDLEAMRGRNDLAAKNLANNTNDANSSLYYNAKNTAFENLKKIEKLLETTDTSTARGTRIAKAYNKLYIDFTQRFGDPSKSLDPIEEQGKITAFMAEALQNGTKIF